MEIRVENVIRVIRLLLVCQVFVIGGFLHADEIELEEDLLDLYGDELTVSIATGTKQPISTAPAVATVITSREIKAMRARDIDDVLETVPGLHVSRSTVGYNPIYTFRGIYSEQNPQVLMLVNGISINNLFVGDRGQVWGGFPVESISRIEIIRGPGSAIYGADAFSGVINIITKKAHEINGTEVGARVGSFNTQEAWLMHGHQYKGVDIAFMMEAKTTNGHREKVDSDAQTLADINDGTNASWAPGATNNGRDSLDLRLDVQKGYWQFRAGLQQRRNVEMGFGAGRDLDIQGEFDSDRWNADLTFHNPMFSEYWDLHTQVSFFQTSQEVDENIYISAPGSLGYPDGLIGNPEVWERHWRLNTTASYSGFDDHQLRFGIGYDVSDIYKVKDMNNIFGVLTDFTDTAQVFLPENDRKNKFFFLQDIWNFANDWTLTSGLRFDDYNDFGSTWNPRAAIVWSATHDTTIKLLYGQAFRAPSFAEFRNQNNPVALGNDDLDPEKIETFELALDTRRINDVRLGLNLFHYEWEDIIDFVPITSGVLKAQNQGKQKGYGAEIELDWQTSNSHTMHANYAYQHSRDENANENSGNAPSHQAYARFDWDFHHNWTFSPSVKFILDRKRPANDARSELDDYAVVDITLSNHPYDSQLEFALGVRNLLDETIEEPTDASFNISNDLPLAGRNIFAELRLAFD